jgi:hypothetical protein
MLKKSVMASHTSGSSDLDEPIKAALRKLDYTISNRARQIDDSMCGFMWKTVLERNVASLIKQMKRYPDDDFMAAGLEALEMHRSKGVEFSSVVSDALDSDATALGGKDVDAPPLYNMSGF